MASLEVTMMRSFEAGGARRYPARWVRWIGVDGNPLRRGTDRMEAAVRLAMVILLVVAVPVTAVFAGQLADHVALHTVQTWIGRNGAATDPPVDHREIAGKVCIAVVLTCLVSSLGLLALQTLALRALDRRRLSAWGTE